MIKNVLRRVAEVLLAGTIAGGIAIAANVPNLTGIFEPNQLAALFNTLVQSINFNSPGIVLVQTSTFGTNIGTTNEQALFVQTLPASALTVAGQSYRIRCWGTSDPFTVGTQGGGTGNYQPPQRLVGISLGPIGSSSIGGFFGSATGPGGANPVMFPSTTFTGYVASPSQISYNQALTSSSSESWSMELLVTYNSSIIINGVTTSGLTWLGTGTHGASVSSPVASVDILDSLSQSGNLAANLSTSGNYGAGTSGLPATGGPMGPYQARCGAKLPTTGAAVPTGNPQNADVLGLGFMVEQVK